MANIGEIPRSIGSWTSPDLTSRTILHLLIPALLIAFLASIESLLSARVADGMAHVRHDEEEMKYDPNRELFGQGLATASASIFGGMPATGAIARTSVNVRSKAKSRLASMSGAIVLLFVAVIAAPIVSEIPSAAIAGVLLGTSYRILNPVSLMEMMRTTKSEMTVFLVTAFSTVVIDLIWGIGIGIALHFLFEYSKRRFIS